jgi:UDP-N-acetylmuramyl pentapeptide phosphotransferase/UDP-N-acetylglucosamine-1-phosphate transferase
MEILSIVCIYPAHMLNYMRSITDSQIQEVVFMNVFMDRMLRAAKLDVHLYEEVEADKSAMPQAMGVVVLASVAAGIGPWAWERLRPGNFLLGIVASLGAWYIWAFLTYLSVRDSFRNRKPMPTWANCCAPSAFQVLPA